LIVFTFIYKKYKLSRLTFPVAFILITYSLFWITVLPVVRHHKIDKIVTSIYEVFKKQEKLEYSLKQTLVIQKETAAQKIPATLQKTNDQLNTQNINQPQLSPQQKKQDDQELRYLRSTWWVYGHSMSRITAWTMRYVPKYHPYFGFTYEIRNFLHGLLPIFPRTNGNIGAVIGREVGMKSGGLAFGLFGMGYCCYGFIGGYFYCCIFGILGGLMSKFGIINLFDMDYQFEYLPLALLFTVFLANFLTGGFANFTLHARGIIFFLFFLYLFNLYRINILHNIQK
jgi:hypothetical protein